MRIFTLIASLTLVLAAGCSSRQVYDSAGGWRQAECNKMIDDAARANCLKTASEDYDTYRKQQSTAAQ